MIRRIHIRGMGPHRNTTIELDAKGVTTVAGPSEAGKTTLEDAIAFALWGVNRQGRALHHTEVNDDADEVQVELELISGSRVARTLRFDAEGNRGEPHRSLKHQAYKTEKAFRSALKALGDEAKLRPILVPMSWVPLAQGPGEGRPLVDYLAQFIGAVDTEAVVRELLAETGDAWRRGDPIHDKDAEDLRRRAKKDRDQLQGQVDAGKLFVAQAKQDTMQLERDAGATDAGAAGGLVEMAKAWDAYDTKQAAYVARIEAAAKRASDIRAWDKRMAQLGDKPDGSALADLQQAEAARADAENARAARSRELGQADGDLTRARKDRERLEEHRHPAQSFTVAMDKARRAKIDLGQQLEHVEDCCPTCGQMWDGARKAVEDRLEQLGQELADATAAFEAEAERLEAERQAAIQEADAEVARLEEAAAKAQAAADEAAVRYVEAQAAVTKAQDKARPAKDWAAARAALGDRPEELTEGEGPTAPSHKRPTAEELAQAKQAIEDAGEVRGRLLQRRKDLADAERGLERLRSELATAEDEVAHFEALVDAVRRAPAEGLRRAAGRVLGDLGPVRLEFLDSGGVDVLVDGRHWDRASDGRLIVADTFLRAAFRRAARAGWMPMVIDRSQDVGGQPLPTPAPAIVLTTTDDARLRVVGKELAHV